MLDFINQYIDSFKKSKNFKVSLVEIEAFVEGQFENLNQYDNNGGYNKFYESIKYLEAQNKIMPVKATEKKITNGKRLSLPIHWWVIVEKAEQKWSTQEMMIVSTKMNLDFYKNRPHLQTEETWEKINQLYKYLKKAVVQEWVSKEERAYQIFGNEKALDTNEECRKLLSNVKITFEDLKVKQYGEPFVYWTKPNNNLDTITRILITENLSFFHSCRRHLKENSDILGSPYQMLIYGGGHHIESSLPFIKEIIESENFYLDYVGDIDPTGISIYCRLKENYPELPLRLAVDIYRNMILCARVENQFKKGQFKNEEHYKRFSEEFVDYPEVLSVIQRLKTSQLRIPQETISLEQLKGGSIIAKS